MCNKKKLLFKFLATDIVNLWTGVGNLQTHSKKLIYSVKQHILVNI
jgi:hypothetical protein